MHEDCPARKHGRDDYYRRRYGCTGLFTDEVAIERAKLGDPVRLTRAERRIVVAQLTAAGLSQTAIAERLHTSRRAVCRHRAKSRLAQAA